ncbi:unnamed protein product [marine sediment metagenome]|uniref:Uncharacterized protein n=1 Tax=marine sediment metagenome TaxID=412755 RepID=X1NSI4_9ZZZZ
MQKFTAEFKAIKDTLDKCWGERGSKKDTLNRLIEARKKTFANIYLGKVSPSKKKIINSEIRQLEEDVSDLDITIKELEHRYMLLKKQGLHIQEVKEA